MKYPSVPRFVDICAKAKQGKFLGLRRTTTGREDAEQLDGIARVMAAGQRTQVRSDLKIEEDR